MGQNPSTEGTREPSTGRKQVNEVPYTKFSQEKSISSIPDESVSSSIVQRGITVVNPHPHSRWRKKQPMELQKLDKVHRFWPILRSSMDSIPPIEKIPDGIGYKPVTAMCRRYQEHLSEAANIVGMEQKALASRLKDLEMFSAGVAQQMIRQQERLHRAQLHLEKVDEVKSTMDNIAISIKTCAQLVRKLNSLLPEEERLEKFKLHPELEDDSDVEDGATGSLQGAGWRRTESEALDVIDDVDDDDVDLDDSCFPVTDPVTTPPDVGGASAVGGGGRLHHNEVEQDWRTAIN